MVSANIPVEQQPLASMLLTSQRTGAILIGSYFSAMLLGVALYQTATYYMRFRHDRLIFQLVVGALMAISVAHTFVLSTWQFNTLIIGFGDVVDLTSWDFLVTCEWALLSTCATITQCFYAWRVYSIMNRTHVAKFLTAVILSFAAAGLIAGWALAIRQAQLGNSFPVSPLDAIRWLFALAYAFPAVADLAIMAGMLLGLRRVNQLALPAASHRIISRIFYLSIECQALTCLLVLAIIVAFALNQRPIALAIGACLPKAYQITLVNSLLNRRSHEGKSTSESSGAHQMRSVTTSPTRSGIVIHKTTHVQIDDAFGTREVKLPRSATDGTMSTDEIDLEKSVMSAGRPEHADIAITLPTLSFETARSA